MHHVASVPGSKGSATHATMQRLPHTSAVFPPDQQEYESYWAAALKKCSIICGCDIRTQAQLQMFQKWMRGPNGATAQDQYASKMRVSQSLPFFAAKLLDPAAGHQLAAAQDVLLFCRE
jgi:hypothetical protein